MAHRAGGASGRTALISGAGIAGLTLGYWLNERGWRPTIIEQAPALRAGGYGIDFAGSGWDVAELMGILPELRRRANRLRWLSLKGRAGQTLMRAPLERLFRALDNRVVQIMRAELEAILAERLGDTVPIRFGNSIGEITQLPDRVDVGFQDGSSGSYDIVVGADGLHSNVRRLIFGDERPFRVDLGYAFATFPIPGRDEFVDSAALYFEPGRQASVYPDGRDGATALLVYRTAESAPIPPERRKAALQRQYEGAGWIVPAIIDSITDSTAIYHDSITQIQMPRWTEGRVALVGDAAHCLTLISGQGASTAMGGAYILAEELGGAADHCAAFAAYERRVRPFVTTQQERARRVAQSFVPASPLGVYASQAVMRLLFTPLLAPLLGRGLGLDSLLRPA